jgi:hypothetical protein
MKAEDPGRRPRIRIGTLLLYGWLMVAMGVGLLAEAMLHPDGRLEPGEPPADYILGFKRRKIQMVSACALMAVGFLAIAWSGERRSRRGPRRKKPLQSGSKDQPRGRS